ncbi:hypothetical protein MTR67_038474 [Solanum verrucosum]|uniref:Uncharacterized protein n=2 Tax=Solanum verrucosum TaxID=315347 RepID=A0AAF0UGW6_SOLVR|nr:hypothetical protein MTR67_038474 [Solanum verrucosum]
MAPNYVMMVGLIILICFSLSFGYDAMLPTHNNLIAKPNCKKSCGNVSIPFPFGVTQDCVLYNQFLVTCNYTFQPPRLFFYDSAIQITNISLTGQLTIFQFISKDCYESGINTENNTPWITLTPLLAVSNTANKFIAIGCDTYAIVQGYYSKFENMTTMHYSYITGCTSMCNSLDDADNNTCSGVGCCKTSIPKGAWNVTITLSSYYNHTYVNDNPSCSYAFVVEDTNPYANFSKNSLESLQNMDELPLVLDWVIGKGTCEIAKRNSTAYGCKSENSDCYDSSIGYGCYCMQGYDGNPYLKDGCQDIDECIDRQPDYRCAKDAICQNTEGNYTCICPPDFSGNGTVCNGDNPQRITQNIYFVIGATAGVAFAIIIVFGWAYTAFQRRKMSKMKKKFFQENGGLVLQQRLTREEGSSHNNTIKIFTAEELEKATNGFDKDRVVGQGGFGTVYKGYLKDNCIVAIKKSKLIDRNQIEQFINEVLVLSQINHRNVVKLLGCCLETEVPLLVYEFISNGTLSEHLHDKLKASNLSLDIRLRVAAETAGVLSYLHSAAYPPIIHRDIKSVNILLDKSYTAKVSDFGASRLVPADQTELSTLVQGTLGYLDPEYLQTNQLNEKSDVYSFGVVLVELLTGRKALCFERPAEERSLAQYFISSVEKGLLLDILDDNIVYDKTNEKKLKNVVKLAQRCLNVKGDERPTMKEVAAELEAGLRLKYSWAETDRHSEEKESLLPGTQRLRFGYEYSEHSTDADSITSHVTLPFPGGR